MDFVRAVSTFFCSRRRVEAVAGTVGGDANVVVKAAEEVVKVAAIAEPLLGPLSWIAEDAKAFAEDAKASAEALEAGAQLLAGIASDLERLSAPTTPVTVGTTA